MKIVLRQDVPKLGEAGTIQEVKPGFARNYLIPQGMAVLATAGEVKTAEHNAGVKARKVAKQEAQLQSLADKIEGKRLEFTVRAGEGGRLYGSITAGDIADELVKLVGEEVDRRKVVLEDPIRNLGEHTVTVHLVGRLRPAVTVSVVGDAEYQAAHAAAEAAKAKAKAEDSSGETPGAAGHPEPGSAHDDSETTTVDEGPSHEWVDDNGVPGAHGFIDNEGGAATLTEESGKGVDVEEELDPVGEA
ncbi:MAG: 50S ribosomal protein L9 [Chloroflexi bacterium]|nr:50S ribosomal protein L9 [Chloroflexota bacterium]